MSISTPAGGDRQGRRPKRLLTPSQKYEIWLQLVRQEVTVAEAAANHRVDRTTIMRIRTIAKEGALAASKQTGRGGPATRLRTGGRQGRERPTLGGPQGDGGALDVGRGKRALGLA